MWDAEALSSPKNSKSANGRLPKMRVLLLNLVADPLAQVNQALSGQGYEVTVENDLNVDQVLALSPEVLVTQAAPSDLTCCGLITSLKSRRDNRPLKIVMIVQGGALERARALDLGADDVISFPFDDVEFAARIRTQFRTRQPEEELKTMLKFAVQRENIADLAVESLKSDVVTKRRFWLIPAIFALAAAALIASLTMLVSNHQQPQGRAPTKSGNRAAEPWPRAAGRIVPAHTAGARFDRRANEIGFRHPRLSESPIRRSAEENGGRAAAPTL